MPVVGRPRVFADPGVEPSERAKPAAPKSLGRVGRAAWRVVVAQMPLAIPELDALAIRRFAELLDERELVRAAWLEHGPLLDEPIVTPKGDVVGTRRVPNPAAEMLRALDRELDALSDRLALTPAARARLGLTMTSAEKAAAEVDKLLAKKWRAE